MCGSPPPPLLQLLLFIACWRQVGGTIQQYAPLPPPVAVLPLERQSSTNGAVLLTVLTATRPDRQTAEPQVGDGKLMFPRSFLKLMSPQVFLAAAHGRHPPLPPHTRPTPWSFLAAAHADTHPSPARVSPPPPP